MRRALSDHDANDRTLAAAARFAAAPVHPAFVLVASVAAVGTYEIVDRRTADVDGAQEHAPGFAHERGALRESDASRGARRADLGAKQRFVGVDVPDSGDHALVEQ